ncbi:MAG: prephenate dehydrogenase/arogenate dehydrogenase family protein [Clostridia bacterium]|nr:prephenate dehydrogenase/arogenate dehydrogenase family protein [Clostridia bacterium]
MTVGIVGLGLIGGSMAKSIKAHTEHVVLGADIKDEAISMAKMTGAIDGVLNDNNLPECDIVMIAISPLPLLSWAEENAHLIKGTLVDLCGVKRNICKELGTLAQKHGFSYVGGHPMAGKEVSGFANASAALFSGASMILTPNEKNDIETLDMLKTFFLEIGFDDITFSTPEEHDRIIAYTSQLAHITSSAYIKSPFSQKHMGFSAGSYKDMTRVARLDENLWTELFLENADFLVDELKILVENLSDYLDVLQKGDKEKLREMLKNGRLLKMSAGGE